MEPTTSRATFVTPLRRAALFAGAAILVCGLGAAAIATARPARAQEPAKAQPVAPGEIQKVRGILEWRRAVWAMDRTGYARASQDLFVARQLQEHANRPDHTTNFVLGLTIALLGRSADAQPYYLAARTAAESFPGNLLLDEVIFAADIRADSRADNLTAAEMLDRYFLALASYERSAPYHAELEFLGYTQRGTRNFRAERFDRAITDFTRAVEIARANKRPPAAELTRVLALCHQRLDQSPEAERLIFAALRRDPGEPSHYHVIGQLKADNKKFDQSAAWYEQAARRRPDYPEPHLKLAYLAGEGATPDVWRLRSSLERYQVLMEVELGADLTRPPPAGAVVPERERSARINLLAGHGVYWRARADRAADAGDHEVAKACNERALVEFRSVLAIEPNCMRALHGIIQTLHLLQAPDEEAAPLKKRLSDLNDTKPGEGRPYGDTFC